MAGTANRASRRHPRRPVNGFMPTKPAELSGPLRDVAVEAAQGTIWSAVLAELQGDSATAAALCVTSADSVLCEAAVTIVANLLKTFEGKTVQTDRAQNIELAENSIGYLLGQIAEQAARSAAGV